MKTFRFLNAVLFAHIAVFVVTLVGLASLDTQLPAAFVFALFSPKFWSVFDTSAAVAVGFFALFMVGVYISAGRTHAKPLPHAQLGAVACSGMCAFLTFILMLSAVE